MKEVAVLQCKLAVMLLFAFTWLVGHSASVVV